MGPRMSYRLWLLIGMMFLCTAGNSAWASPSGLNNIPTTDVVPVKTLVLQTWLNMAEKAKTQQFVGFKTGVIEGLEVGIDWKANGQTHGHAELQAKYAFDIIGDWGKGVVGIANVTDNRQHNGEVFPYAAISADLKVFRLHFGFAPQPHNEAFFAGIDRTILVLNRNLQLKADAIHINDKRDVLFSVGFLYEFGPQENAEETPEPGIMGILNEITKNLILESWVSLPTSGDEEVYTVKFDYVISF